MAEETNVKESDEYYNAVLWALQNDATTGTTATTFSPNDTVTRAQIVTFLYRYAGKPEVTGDMPFTDVRKGKYFYEPVLWALEKNITTGTSETPFSPFDLCTRGHGVTFIYRLVVE